jgi:hypothetical protein
MQHLIGHKRKEKIMALELVKNVSETTVKESAQSKKERILTLFKGGNHDIEKIANLSGAKPSYVGSVLHKEGLIDNYFDLYTSTAYPMNIYTKYFRGKLGFKDVKTAENGVHTLEQAYRYFSNSQDRAGQHHTLEMALTMLNRARWTGKADEAEIYRLWLVRKLSQPISNQVEEKAQAVEFRLVA